MSENCVEARQSKIYTVLTCIGALLIFAAFCGIAIYMLSGLLTGNYVKTADALSGFIFTISELNVFAFLILALLIWVIYVYKKQIDIYTSDKIIRKRGNKIIFVMSYENIIEIREGFESVFMILKSNIIKANGKEGTRNFYTHYSRADISRIKNMITQKYFNIQFN